MSKKYAAIGIAGLLALLGVGVLGGNPSPGPATLAPGAGKDRPFPLIREFAKGPVFFIPNRGQTDSRVGFYVQGADKTVYFTSEGVTFALQAPSIGSAAPAPSRWVTKMDFVGARKDARPEGLEKTGASISYFRGKPEEWKTGLPAYSGILYRDLWPGIDLVYKGETNKLKYEVIVRPGADPSKIRFAYRGVDRVTLTDEGRLAVETPAGGFEDDIPVAYQEAQGRSLDVGVRYTVSGAAAHDGTSAYGFSVGDYDRSLPLVIDPAVIVYCGYVGGESPDGDCGRAIAVDASGNAYITGIAHSDASSFPVTVGPDLTPNGAQDAFVAKVNSSGTGLAYCGYIGGTGDGEAGLGIAVDGSGNAYVAGLAADGTGFPVKVGPDLTYNGGEFDIFVAKVNPSGTDLVYCGYIGGAGQEHWCAIAVDDQGYAYVSGRTESTQTSFPVKVGPDLTFNGSADAFVAKVDKTGASLVYCGYIGGSGEEDGNGIAIDSSGCAYVTGNTNSTQTTFPEKVGPDLTYNGAGDVYVAKVNAAGNGLVYCGYIGGAGTDAWPKIEVDSAGNAYVAGSTDSNQTTFPVKVGPDLTFNGNADAFVAVVNSAGTGLVYCSYIGGSGNDYGSSIAVDASGCAYITGNTFSSESTFPVLGGPDLTFNGADDAFVAKVDATGASLAYCGYIGGSGGDNGYGIAVDPLGNAYITGVTGSSEATFPVKVGPGLTLKGTGGNAFVAKVGDVVGPSITSLSPGSANAGDTGFLLTVLGTGFVDGAVVRWDGNAKPTTFVDGTEVDAEIPTSDLVSGKTVAISVRNPDGGVSGALSFPVYNPLPSLILISPDQVTGGGDAFTLTALGSNFVPNSVIRWNGVDRPTNYLSTTALEAVIPASDITSGGEILVAVFNPAPSGGTSGALTIEVSSFSLTPAVPSATVTPGQSATYQIQVAPLHGVHSSPVLFSCAGLPSKCTAAFAPTYATPGGSTVSTTLTLTTQASASSAGASLAGTAGPGTLGLLVVSFMAGILLAMASGRRSTWRLPRRLTTAFSLLCLVILIASCGGGGDNNSSYTGTPKGTHQITVQGTSGSMTVTTTVTLIVK